MISVTEDSSVGTVIGVLACGTADRGVCTITGVLIVLLRMAQLVQ